VHADMQCYHTYTAPQVHTIPMHGETLARIPGMFMAGLPQLVAPAVTLSEAE